MGGGGGGERRKNKTFILNEIQTQKRFKRTLIYFNTDTQIWFIKIWTHIQAVILFQIFILNRLGIILESPSIAKICY